MHQAPMLTLLALTPRELTPRELTLLALTLLAPLEQVNVRLQEASHRCPNRYLGEVEHEGREHGCCCLEGAW